MILNHIPVKKTMMSSLAEQMNIKLTDAADKIKMNILKNLKKEVAATGGDMKEIQNGGMELNFAKRKYKDVSSYVKTTNEIQELIYMGKVQVNSKNSMSSEKSKNMRQFLIRRKKSLELMFTNGLNHTTSFIAHSEVQDPFHISDVMLSANNKSLIAYYSIQGNESQVFVKTFI